MHRIIVLGAGYAGLAAATGLAGRLRREGRDDVRLTLVDASESFTERLRLHQTATGQTLADLRIGELFAGTGVDVVTGRAEALDPERRIVRLGDGREKHYDTLVYALGARTGAPPAGTYTLDSVTGARSLAGELASRSGGSVAVCGAGLTGLEAAAEIAERHPHLTVTLIGRDEPGASLGPQARRYVAGALRRLGVRVRAGAELTGRADADVVLWTGGVRSEPLAPELAVDPLGRIVTDRWLRSVSHPRIYAIGDAAAVEQDHGVLHGTCQSGMPTGAYAAAAVFHSLRGREIRPFRFGYFHTPVSLGRGDAVVQFTRRDGTPGRGCLTGRAAVRYKETVSASPWPAFERTLRMPRVAMLGWRR